MFFWGLEINTIFLVENLQAKIKNNGTSAYN